ncbi:putative ADP-dependent glucokinase [Apostichopus japonicus]|uniref:Putative ADP-dependent glucokinase n=1 Tax=Stichopus japonicus TaxID=307972 RepID=A0A2G8KVV1_STIJA|nr:putative ADP-dependent glucokinase [Apostichopus japonicus]
MELFDAVPLLEELNIEPPPEVKHYGSIEGKKELSETFAFFFSKGAAGERYLHDKALFEDVLKLVEKKPSAAWYIGGNAPAMANRLAKEGCEVLLGGRMSQKLRGQLQEGVKVVGTPLEKDDVHLIMEYKTGEVWGKYKTPRANRFIVHSDSSNPMLESLDEFREELGAFKPQAVVIGGLQMMDNFPFREEERQSRLLELQKLMVGLSPDIKTHFEFASFAEEQMLRDLLQYIIPYSNSIGMNEQELPTLQSSELRCESAS